MAVRVPSSLIASIEDLETIGVDIVTDKGVAPIDAGREVIAGYVLATKVVERLVEIGAAAVIADKLHRSRSLSTSVRTGILPPDILIVPSQKSDRSMGPMLFWHTEDWRAFVAACNAQTAAFARRAKGGREVLAILRDAKSERVADLPAADIDKVRSIVAGFAS